MNMIDSIKIGAEVAANHLSLIEIYFIFVL